MTYNGTQIFPDGMRSAGDVYDEAIVDSDGYVRKVVKRVGDVDLGTLTWHVHPTDAYFYAVLADRKQYGQGLCIEYNKIYTVSVNPKNIDDKSYVFNTYAVNNGINIKDTAYTDATSFKAAMSGVILYYELATPVEYTVDNPIFVGTEYYSGGIQKVLPENTSEPTTAPFRGKFGYKNYSYAEKQDKLTFDTTPTANSTNPVTSGGVYNALQTMSDAIAYIGDSQGSAQYIDEGGNIVDLSDYAKKTWVEAKNYLTAHQQLKTINNQSLVGEGNITISGGSGSGEANIIEAITFNGSAVPVTNKTAAITATIPAAVTESTVSGWGFTKNAGTLTGVTFNGTAATINNGVAAITATIPSVTTSTALNDGKLLTNGIDVNTKIRGAVFAASNAANADSSSPLGFNTSSSNPYIFLKQGGNTWYCQAYSGNFYFWVITRKV